MINPSYYVTFLCKVTVQYIVPLVSRRNIERKFIIFQRMRCDVIPCPSRAVLPITDLAFKNNFKMVTLDSEVRQFLCWDNNLRQTFLQYKNHHYL